MHSQAQAFFDMVQERLKDPNFEGLMFPDGAILPPMSLRMIDDPEVLIALVAQISEHSIQNSSGNN